MEPCLVEHAHVICESHGTSCHTYPAQSVISWTLANGTPMIIRTIRLDDEPLLVEFHRTLSDHSVHLRYFQTMPLQRRVAHERLVRQCAVDYDHEIALVAQCADPDTGLRVITGVGRLCTLVNRQDAEFAIIVSDHYQCQGIGSMLLRQLVDIGRAAGLARIVAEILPENHGMVHVARKLGFRIKHIPHERTLMAVFHL